MKRIFTSALLLASLYCNAQYRLGVSKEDIKAECLSCSFKDTLANGRVLLYLNTPNGTIFYDFDDDGLSSSTKMYVDSYYARQYMDDYNRQYKIINETKWEQVLDKHVSVMVEYFPEGSYFYYKFKFN